MPSLIKSSDLSCSESAHESNKFIACDLKLSKLDVDASYGGVLAGTVSNVHGTQIAERFSAAAHSYQDHNQLQRLSAASLLSEFSAAGYLLDIGAGPGTDFSGYHSVSQPADLSTQNSSTTVFAVDIALGMLQKLKQSYPDYLGVCADAQCLPFTNGCMDVIYSNLALQWCADFPAAVAEMARVLKPNGECHLSLVAQGSLNQLAELGLRVNDFSTLEVLKAAFKLDTWQLLEVRLVPMTVYFDTLKALLYSIKGVGASVHVASSTTRVSGSTVSASEFTPRLRGRQDWQDMQAKAESLRLPQGLPLTYQIVQIRARRRF